MKSSLLLSSTLVLVSFSMSSSAAPSQPTAPSQGLRDQIVPVAGMELLPALQRATDVGPADGEQSLCVAVSLPFAKPDDVQKFADDVSDPKSPMYRRFITPEEVGERYGYSQAQVQSVADYLASNGFQVTLVANNRLAVVANGTVAQIERAFHTTIRHYTLTPVDKIEPADFVANSTPIQLPSALAAIVIDVSGVETYTRPEPRTTLLTPALTRALYNSAGVFAAGNTGAGRTIGISSFVGFRSASWINYINHFALPVPPAGAGTNVVIVPIGGGGGTTASENAEGDLDVQMQLGIAPLATIRVYDSANTQDLIATLAQEVNDNLCDAISESYGWNIPNSTQTSAHNNHVSMTAQGITYMGASGDSGTSLGFYPYPNMEPEVLQVGGTIADVNTPSGARITETGWSGSGGGWSTHNIAFNVRPSWQTGTGVPAINSSNNRRLVPDIAFHSSGNGNPAGAYSFYIGGTLHDDYYGTSFAAPMFCATLALLEQDIIGLGGLTPDAQGHRRFGRMQDYVYAQNGRSDIWYDITSGNNGNLPSGQGASNAHVGWDTVTGWGPMDCAVFAVVAACDTGAPCGAGTGTAYCFGDGTGAGCPCVNFGAPGNGCANSVDVSGGNIAGTGTASVSADTFALLGTHMVSGSCLYFSGTTQIASVFGDGIRCVGGTTIRLTETVNVNGASTSPGVGLPLSVVGGLVAGDVRNYQVWYRNAGPFCTPSTFNLTNGLSVTWLP